MSPLVSAEPHHADLTSLEALSRGATVTVMRRDEVPEHTTVTGGEVVIAMVAESCYIQRKEKVNSMRLSIHL